MPARTCAVCNKIFNSSASYRNHKSLFHRQSAQPEEPENETAENTTTDDVKEPGEEPKEREGDDLGWLVAAGGVALVILLALFGKRQ